MFTNANYLNSGFNILNIINYNSLNKELINPQFNEVFNVLLNNDNIHYVKFHLNNIPDLWDKTNEIIIEKTKMFNKNNPKFFISTNATAIWFKDKYKEANEFHYIYYNDGSNFYSKMLAFTIHSKRLIHNTCELVNENDLINLFIELDNKYFIDTKVKCIA